MKKLKNGVIYRLQLRILINFKDYNQIYTSLILIKIWIFSNLVNFHHVKKKHLDLF